MDKVFNKLRNLDAYPKINEDFFSRTLSGGVITLVSSIVMLLLFFSELSILVCAGMQHLDPVNKYRRLSLGKEKQNLVAKIK
ncbi:unnamed protein product [Ilex paraguariensis]|uniref:Endoplasmic reticulum vesicle transporter N-terminal domain-containing protein n=1 Tax=Ilex paraguariensis TaxID=185542 RepID=A0ABC8UBA9_9AQUA